MGVRLLRSEQIGVEPFLPERSEDGHGRHERDQRPGDPAVPVHSLRPPEVGHGPVAWLPERLPNCGVADLRERIAGE